MKLLLHTEEELLICDNTTKIGNNLDLYTHALKTRILDKHGFGSKIATRNFIERERHFRYDATLKEVKRNNWCSV